MRALLLAGLLVSPAFANPCGKPVATKAKMAQNWVGVHQLVTGKQEPVKDDAAATERMCDGPPCGPNEAISIVHGLHAGLGLAFKNPPGSYTFVELPFPVPPTAYEVRLTRLSNHRVHVHMHHEDYGREPFCEDEDRDKNGECTEWVTATVTVGHSTNDAIINTISRAIEWSHSTMEESDGLPGRVSGVVGRPKNLFGYWEAGAETPTQWFRLDKGKCAPAASPIDLKAQIKAARKAASRGALPDAIGLFGELLTYAPGHGALLSERGYLRFKAGDLAGAATDYKAALSTLPDDKLAGVIFFNRGLLKEARGDAKGALGDFREADRRRPSKAAKKKIKALGG